MNMRPWSVFGAKSVPSRLLYASGHLPGNSFEAFLLEVLSAFQIRFPGMGTVHATHRPYVILTSNRTRELSDALKRRCLYHWVDYPNPAKELRIIHKHLPGIQDRLAQQLIDTVNHLRKQMGP